MQQATGHRGRRARLHALARYGLVGGMLVVIEYGLYLAILAVRPGAALPAYILSRLVAGVAGFVGHSRVSFGTAGLSARNGLAYALSVAGNMALAALLLLVMLPLLGPFVAKLVSDGVVIVAGYIVGRDLVFLPVRRVPAR